MEEQQQEQPAAPEVPAEAQPVEETPAAPAEVAPEAAPEPEHKAPEYVPYDRFAEVNEKVGKLEEQIKLQQLNNMPTKPIDPQVQQQKELVKRELGPILEEMGFMSKEEFQRQQQDAALENTLKSLEERHSGKDGLPKFNRRAVVDFALKRGIGDAEVAYETMHRAEIINWHVKQAIAKGTGVKSEQSNGTGSQGAGPSNDDLKAAVAQGDKQALHLLLKRTIAKK